ncbi:hypothetical protein [Dyella tabacisoli]|uniref:Uncharacterized protein n=1 Tax=Dyella tabacisoli TaxID=2282381 RepID=A0A369UL06_9GAMM|nr:hypothetical protein [Dyella tabacisoli]RDD80280.1 hypothetical protein DVJ77_17665 [Dyella tabacisoli]
MKAVWQLWLQPWKRMPVLAALVSLMWLAAMGMYLFSVDSEVDLNAAALGLIAFGSWFWHIGQGQILRELCRPESFLMPDFLRRLTWTAAIDAAQWVLLPALLSGLLGLPHAWLIAAALLCVAALGLVSSQGRRAGLLIWPIFIVAGWKPELAVAALHIALQSPLTAPLLLLVAVLILHLSLRPLLRIDDRDIETSPLESMSLDRSNNIGGTPPPRGALSKRLVGLFDRTSQRALDLALRSYRQQPGARQRLTLIRRLLLPHDNPLAIALRLTWVAAFVTIYFFAAIHRQHFNAAVVGAYATLLTLGRFPQLGRGMQRIRPNLADLYLTLAPTTHAQYQKTLADALLILVPISVLSAVAYTLLGIALTHAAEPVRMLMTTIIVTSAASLVALAVHLIGPESTLGRTLANIVVILGAMASYWGGYWLIGALGYVFGGGLVAIIALSFGLSVWFAGQREYQRRKPSFDAPMA